MNISWHSPLDAQSSEIARYSAELLPVLSEFVGISGIDDGSDSAAPTWWPQELTATAEMGVAPLPVYHIGNNPSHLHIFRQSLKEPGLIVLHDLSLVDLARHLSHQLEKPELWKEQMCRQYGEEVRALVNRSEKSVEAYNEMVAHYPLFMPFLAASMGVVCHSRYAYDELVRQLPAGTPIAQLNLPARPAQAVNRADDRCGPLRFVFCGHVGPNRRLIEFMEAWAGLPDPSAVQLDLFGNIHSSTQLLQYARHYGVGDHVKLRGYVSDEELDQALQSADFAINLRWPTMGEASASQLRYWSAALPTLVSDVGWYGELPDDAVCKISIDNESADLLALLRDALTDPGKYREVGVRGWQQLKTTHCARHYAEGLVELARTLSDRRLAYRLLDQELVGAVASMCHGASDSRLFRSAIEIAVECCKD